METHIRISNAPLRRPSDDQMNLSTSAWDRYGPDVAAEYPWDVVRPVQMAYAALDDDSFAALRNSSPEGRDKSDEFLRAWQEGRRIVLAGIAKGYDALRPHLRDAEALAAEAPQVHMPPAAEH